MKKLSLIIALLIASIGAVAQHLFISQISSPFPGPGGFQDSATVSGVTITIRNLDSINTFMDEIDIFMNGNGNPPQALYTGTNLDSISPLDSINIQPPPFQFYSQNFDDGDNIVVIWPVARHPQPGQVFDSLSYHVFFSDLPNVVDELGNHTVTLYPNPTTQYILIEDKDKSKIRQVRITDSAGKEVYKNIQLDSMISIENWRAGIYFVEVFYTNGQKRSLKVVKN